MKRDRTDVSCVTCEKKLGFFYLGFFKPWYSCDACGQYHCYDCDKLIPLEVEYTGDLPGFAQ